MVSPGSSRSTAARASMACRSVAATTASRTRLCHSSTGSRRARGSGMSSSAVVNGWKGEQFRRFGLGKGVTQEVAAANLGTGKVLQELGLAQRRVTLDVKVKSAIVALVRGRLMECQHVGKRHLPEIVVADEQPLERRREIRQLTVRHRR